MLYTTLLLPLVLLGKFQKLHTQRLLAFIVIRPCHASTCKHCVLTLIVSLLLPDLSNARIASSSRYGDYAPQTQTGRFIAIVFIPLTVGAMGHFLSIVATLIMESRRSSFQRQLERRELSIQDLELMDLDGDGEVTRAEFLEFMLVSMGKVEKEFIEEMRQYFAKLDTDGTGALSKGDLIENARSKLKLTSKKLQLSAYKQSLQQRAAQAVAARRRYGDQSPNDDFWGTRMSFFNLFQGEHGTS
jgi:hypothetical protein